MSLVHSTSMTSSTIVITDNTVKLGITLPKSTIRKIDQRRGDIPRSRYIRRVIERYLTNNKDIDSIDNKAMAAAKKKEEEIRK
jgi:metal-responsive CopG/Arc/MetJ family transcriptional regulator